MLLLPDTVLVKELKNLYAAENAALFFSVLPQLLKICFTTTGHISLLLRTKEKTND